MSIRSKFIIGIFFILAGTLAGYDKFIEYAYKLEKGSAVVASSTDTAPKPVHTPTNRIEGKPVRLTITKLGIDLPVDEGYYNAKTQSWNLSLDKVQYAIISPMPNNELGSTFIYGHNRRGVLNSLYKVQPGTEAVLLTDNGHQFVYEFVNSYETSPSDSSIFNYRGAPILTIQTCSGFWYQNRQLFSFKFTRVI